jgi:hypothetical protein
MIRAKRRLRDLVERSIEEHHFRMHPMQHDQVFIVQIMADHHDAVAVAANQKTHSLDSLLARRHFSAAGCDHHMPAHGAQFSIGLFEDGAVIGAEKRRHENTDHAERLRGHRAADGRRTEVQLLDCGPHARCGVG